MMAKREYPPSAAGNFGRYGSEIKSSASNAPPMYRKYRARGIPHSICPLPSALIEPPVPVTTAHIWIGHRSNVVVCSKVTHPPSVLESSHTSNLRQMPF